MSKVFFDSLEILQPDYHLEIGWNMLVDVDEKKIVLCAQDFPEPSHTAGQEAFGMVGQQEKLLAFS